MTGRYELVPHTADLALRVRGRDLAGLLADAASVGASVEVPVDLSTPDREALVVALANELIYRRDAEGLLLPGLTVLEAEGGRLRGVLCGEAADPARHALRAGLKAATWHQLAVRDRPGGELEAFVVFDV